MMEDPWTVYPGQQRVFPGPGAAQGAEWSAPQRGEPITAVPRVQWEEAAVTQKTQLIPWTDLFTQPPDEYT